MRDLQHLLSLIKIPKYRVKKTKDERTPRLAVVESLETIPESVWMDPSKHWLDPTCGRGTILLEMVIKLRNYHSDKWISEHLWAIDLDLDALYTTRAVLEKELRTDKLNIIHADFLTWQPPAGMRFNGGVNPPWNISNVPTATGTGGNVVVWKEHYNKLLSVFDEHFIVFATKGIITTLRTQTQINPIAINLMTDTTHWNKNACWITIQNKPRSVKNLDSIVIDKCPIIKMISIQGDNPNYHEINGGTTDSYVNYHGNDAVRAITKLPGEKSDIQFGNVNPKYGNLVKAGPKFAATRLESMVSYTVTKEAIAAPHMAVYSTSGFGPSLANAEKMKLFVKNNPLLKEIQRRLKTKGPTLTLKHIRPFDPNQLVTGTETPKEWNLSKEEVKKFLQPNIDNLR